MRAPPANATRFTLRVRRPGPPRCAIRLPKIRARCIGPKTMLATYSPGRRTRKDLIKSHASSTTRPKKAAETGCRSVRLPRPNSDIKNLELEHGRVSLSLQVLTKSCGAFDPPIDASGLDWGWYRAGPSGRGRTPFFPFFFAIPPQ